MAAIRDLPFKELVFSSVCGSLLLHSLPRVQESPHFKSVAVGLFSLQFLVWVTWKVIIYPKYWSSLRHLPGPKVSPVAGVANSTSFFSEY
jgi:hypothetical protein